VIVAHPMALALDRRTFLGNGALAAALLALAACGLDVAGPSYGPTVGNTLTVANYPELLNVGGVALVTYRNAPLAIERSGEASFLALSRVCPHQGGIVSPGGGGFMCPRHGARFDSNGKWIGGQRTTSLRTVATSYDIATDTLSIG